MTTFTVRPSSISAALIGVFSGMVAVNSFSQIAFTVSGFAICHLFVVGFLAIIAATLAADALINSLTS